MPPIHLSNKTYTSLVGLMVDKIQLNLKTEDKEKFLKSMISNRSKIGITFDCMVSDLIHSYKEKEVRT